MSQTFTNEADKLYNKYISELRDELYKNNFSDLEVKETISDVTSQILELCEFKENGVIGTDALRHVLNKLGTPKEISETLSSASGFMDEAETIPENNVASPAEYLHFRVRHLIRTDQIINWLLAIYPMWLISSFIIFFADPYWDDMLVMYFISLLFYIIIYGFSVLIWHLIDKYRLLTNNLVRTQIRPMSRQLYLPILFILTTLLGMMFTHWLLAPFIIAEAALVGLVVYYISIMNRNHAILIKNKG